MLRWEGPKELRILAAWSGCGVVVKRAADTVPCTMPHPGPLGGGTVVRRWDWGEVPSDHTPEIRTGRLFVLDELDHCAAQRYCSACAVAAGIAELGEPAEVRS